MEHHLTRFHDLCRGLKERGLLGPAEPCPLKEILFSAAEPSAGIDLVPRAGADEALVREAVDFCEGFDWGGRRGPPVRLANPWREPERVLKPGE